LNRLRSGIANGILPKCGDTYLNIITCISKTFYWINGSLLNQQELELPEVISMEFGIDATTISTQDSAPVGGDAYHGGD